MRYAAACKGRFAPCVAVRERAAGDVNCYRAVGGVVAVGVCGRKCYIHGRRAFHCSLPAARAAPCVGDDNHVGACACAYERLAGAAAAPRVRERLGALLGGRLKYCVAVSRAGDAADYCHAGVYAAVDMYAGAGRGCTAVAVGDRQRVVAGIYFCRARAGYVGVRP